SAGLGRLLSERQAPDRRRAVFLDARFALGAAAPRCDDEAGGFAEVLDHLVVRVWVAERPPLLFVAGGLEERLLHLPQHLVDRDSRAGKRDLLLLAGVAPRDGDCCRREVAAADLDAERHALQLPLVELEAGPVLGPIVDTDANTRYPQLVGDGSGGLGHISALGLAEDRHGDNLLRRDATR